MRTKTDPVPGPAASRSGTQSVERAVFLLRELATRGATGWRLQDLAQHCGLDRGTVHRLLKCLVEERLVQQRGSDRRYVLGPMNYELALSVTASVELGQAIRAMVRRLTRELPKLVAISSSLRSGDDSVCVARGGTASHITEASRPRIGKRVPLLAGIAGICIVAELPAHEARAIRARNLPMLANLGEGHMALVQTLLDASAGKGYAFSEGVMWRGIHSMAVPFGPPGAPLGSIIASGSVDDYSAADLHAMLPLLRQAAAPFAQLAG
ncbi:IclR family transcriptional regulator [Ramlibacter sp.]|uniref:IclR family transcriptional regulator n=1 Tax=Ramlibacter sp. TaxID=1917967 RepID=UPI003D0B98BC